jgi:hypothetical protein
MVSFEHRRMKFKLTMLVFFLSLSTLWAKNFKVIRNKRVQNSIWSQNQKNILLSVKIIDPIHCMGECSKNKLCNLIVINSAMICNAYLNMPLNNAILVDSIGTNMYVYDNSEYTFLNNLTYYWPFNSYNGLKDLINGVTLAGGGSVSHTKDRFSNPSSALYLKYGWLWLNDPSRVYLTSSFTLSLWICIRDLICSIILLAHHLTFYHCGSIRILIDNLDPVLASSNKTLTLNKWQRLS